MLNKDKNQIITLGCRLNIFESEVIKNMLDSKNYENFTIINTCTVTQKAHNESIQKVKQVHKNNPNAKIIVTGCGAQVAPDDFINMPQVYKVLGNKDKFRPENYTNNTSTISDVNAIEYSDVSLPQFQNKTRAFIQIQQGCDHKCSFCIIPAARGTSISFSQEKIIEQITQVVKSGHKEVILTGVDISSWNRNVFTKEESQIGLLCKEILKQVPELMRLRLSSLDPAVFDIHIQDLLRNEPRFMPHIHLSLQSMNNKVLANMGRRHTKEQALEWIEQLKSANSNVIIGADIIAGFPRETEEQFIDTKNALMQAQIPLLHIFPYSERKGTAAIKMKPINIALRKERAEALRKHASVVKQKCQNSQIGTNTKVLVEKNNTGYTENYLSCVIEGNAIENNTIMNIEVIGINNNKLLGRKII